MNDPGAQQPSQMFLTCVKARPHTGNSVPYPLRIVCGFFNVPQLFTTRVVRRELRLIVLIREDLKVCWCNYKGSTFYSVIFKTLSVGPAGVELTTSRMITRCSSNWANGGRNTKNSWYSYTYLYRNCFISVIDQCKGSVSYGQGGDISFPYCLSTGIWNLAPKAITGPKCRGTSLGYNALALRPEALHSILGLCGNLW